MEIPTAAAETEEEGGEKQAAMLRRCDAWEHGIRNGGGERKTGDSRSTPYATTPSLPLPPRCLLGCEIEVSGGKVIP